MTTDAQAALAAAATVLRSSAGIRGASPAEVEEYTLRMANAFLAWLGRPGQATAVADERLVPNEDFRSPSHAITERIDPNAVTFAAAERARMASAALNAATDAVGPWRTASGEYTGPHVRGGPEIVTPSGAYACLCGEKWPCSQSDTERRRRELSEATQVLDTWKGDR